jgi:hypothetical protein
MVKTFKNPIVLRIKKMMFPTSSSSSIGRGSPESIVPIDPSMVVTSSPRQARSGSTPKQMNFAVKFGLTFSFVFFLQLILLITTLALWQSSNESASYVTLCVGYFLSYAFVILGFFFTKGETDLAVEVQMLKLKVIYISIKFLLILQLATIFLQRAIIPDLWVLAIPFFLFLLLVPKFFYDFKKIQEHLSINKLKTFRVIGVCIVACQITMSIYFGLVTEAFNAGKAIQDCLPTGALFVPIFFGMIANTLVTVISKNWVFIAETPSGQPPISQSNGQSV